MINLRDYFRHDRSRYERPNLGWRCGRAAMWGMPCERGPSAAGVCCGVSACRPVKRGGAWTCCRTPANGGSCGAGPSETGECGQLQPPCVPRRTLSVWRGRLAVVAFGVALALIGLFSAGSAGKLSSIEPGPLTAQHAQFTQEAGCASCHTADGAGAAGWWKAFWTPASQPMAAGDAVHSLSGACAECHTFGGKEQLAHNTTFEKRSDVGPTDCLSCHTEHRGAIAPVSTITDAQCQSCHTVKVHDFTVDHPPFPKDFPGGKSDSIRFDHAAHMNKYFTDPKFAKLAPQSGCAGCHQSSDGMVDLQQASFKDTCANCHADAISKHDFVMFKWPVIEKNEIAPASIQNVCGVKGQVLADLQASMDAAKAGKTVAPKAQEDFSAVSLDDMTAVSAYVLGVPANDSVTYSGPVQKFLAGVIADGAGPFVAAAHSKLPNAATDRLFAGFNAEQARQAGCAWAANQEYDVMGAAAMSGWRADTLDIRYAKPSHADPTIKAWIEALAAQTPPADADERQRWSDARKEIMSASEGPGQCFKCHTASGPADGPLVINWNVAPAKANVHTRFDHRPHLSLMGPDKGCDQCHQPSNIAGTGAKNFAAITVSTCSNCHADNKVRDDCQLCHVYHQDSVLKRRVVSREN